MRSIEKRAPGGRWLSGALAVLIAVPPGLAQQPPAAPPATQPPANPPSPQPPSQIKPMAPLPTVQDLRVIALAGNNEENDLERNVMAPLVVEVLDQNSRPVEGASVVFRFPLNGPGATFRNQQTSKTVRTDGRGQAAATGWLANGQVGTFEIRVTASYGNETGETTVMMSNVTRVIPEDKKSKSKSGRSWWSSPWVKVAVIGGAAAAVAGIVLATTGGSSHSSSHTVTITPGPPVVGAPH
jgi:hypothetical protein